MTELIIGTLLALGALSYVLYPMFTGAGGAAIPAGPVRETASAVDEPNRNSAVDALREIEFDRATGKLSDSDYTSLKSSYTKQAVELMRAEGAPACPHCGPRAEAGAVYCSSCGAALFARS